MITKIGNELYKEALFGGGAIGKSILEAGKKYAPKIWDKIKGIVKGSPEAVDDITKKSFGTQFAENAIIGGALTGGSALFGEGAYA